MSDRGGYALRSMAAVASAIALLAAPLTAQSTAAQAKRVDSLGARWRTLVRMEADYDTAQTRLIRGDSIRVGSIIVHSDPQWDTLARATAERLAPLVARAYGTFGERMLAHHFVLRDGNAPKAGAVVLSGILDSQGIVRLRGSDFPNSDALLNSWKQKTEQTLSGEIAPEVRAWMSASVPIDTATTDEFNNARISLLLAPAVVARDCAAGKIDRCMQGFGLTDVERPAFAFYDASERRDMIREALAERRGDVNRYRECTVERADAVCDALVSRIPAELLRHPLPSVARQSLVRVALQLGGEGAFDRFVAPGTMRARIEAAARMPADSVVARWRNRVMETRDRSTTMDAETAIASLAWAALCCALALRSSRWR